MNLSDDEITARAIEQALREVPEPTAEQAHDVVATQIGVIARWHSEIATNSEGLGAITMIRRLEHAARLLRERGALEAERNNLLDRVKALTNAQDGIRARCTAAIDYAREMDAELTRLREALTAIAHGENTPLSAEAAQDYARIARKALEEKT